MPEDGAGPQMGRRRFEEDMARDQKQGAAEELKAFVKEAVQATGTENGEKDDKVCRMQAQTLQDLAEELRGEFENSTMLLRMEIQQVQLSFASALQVQHDDFEGITAVLRKEIEQKQPSGQQHKSSEDARMKCIEQEMAKLRSQIEELANTRLLERDFSETTNSIRRDFMKLTELTVGCLSKVGDMPIEMESLRRDVRPLQQLGHTRSPKMVPEPIVVQQQSLHEEPIAMQQDREQQRLQHMQHQSLPTSPAHDVAWREERKAIAREMATVRVEILRAKDLFLSGQTSAGLVLKDLELLRHDLGRLKEGRGGITNGILSDDNLRVMREQLWLELREELKALVDPVINPNNFSRSRPQTFYMGESTLE